MCTCKEYLGKQLVGKDMDVIAVVGDKETNISLENNLGDVVGLSIGETYARTDLGQVNLSLRLDGKSSEFLTNVPLTQFIPDGERQMWPCHIDKGSKIIAKLTIRVAGLVVAKPIPLIFHHNNKSC